MSEQKTALVTGAAGTMGAAAARGLAESGVRVVLSDIKPEPLEELAAGIATETYTSVFDVSDEQACKQAVQQIEREFGTIDILVNNAGILSNNKLMSTTAEEWRKVLAVNLDSAFYLTQACLPQMKAKGWGRIINVSSFAAKCGGITAGTTYSVSKGAMIALTFSVAAETAESGVTVNAIAPAYVRTPMVEEQLTEEQRTAVVQKIPVKRYCEPDEFAHVVSFLASPKAGFITGEVIDLNGGLQFD